MTNEEIAEKYADKILSDPTHPSIFSKEEVKACIIKVYLDSLKCCENVYNKGLAEGEIIGKEKQWIATGKAQKKTSAKIKDLEKGNAELKKEISVLLSCANCPENKGGYICEKEYNDKCLAQKIEYIKELKDEIIEREKEIEQLKAYESHWDEIEEDAKRIAEENTELKTKNNDLRVFSEKLSENHANEWQEQQQVITELRGKLEKVSEWVKEQEYPDGCIDCEPWDTEKLKEILR